MASKASKAIAAIKGPDRFKPVADLVFRSNATKSGQEVMIIPPSRGLAEESSALLTLEGSGAWIWAQLDGKRSVKQIVQGLVARYRVDEAKAAQDLNEFLVELLSRGLIEK